MFFNCPSFADDLVAKTPVSATQSSPKLSDRLREMSNTLNLLSKRPVSVIKEKSDMVAAQDFHIDLPEPADLKSRHAGDPHDLRHVAQGLRLPTSFLDFSLLHFILFVLSAKSFFPLIDKTENSSQ